MHNPPYQRVGSPFAAPAASDVGDAAATVDEGFRGEEAGVGEVPAEDQSAEHGSGLGDTAAAASASEPPVLPAAVPPESLGEGAWGHTALAASYSAILLLVFVTVCWWVFPAGGVAVAALGAVVSLIGASGRRSRLAATTLVIHITFFFACYLRALS